MRKVFCVDSKAGRSLAHLLIMASENKGIKIKLKVAEREIKNLPKKWDLYFIHLNDLLKENNLEELKKSQPESYFISLGRGGGYFKGTEKISKMDPYNIFSLKEIEQILQEYLTKKP